MTETILVLINSS